jgi:hypothetical protein
MPPAPINPMTVAIRKFHSSRNSACTANGSMDNGNTAYAVTVRRSGRHVLQRFCKKPGGASGGMDAQSHRTGNRADARHGDQDQAPHHFRHGAQHLHNAPHRSIHTVSHSSRGNARKERIAKPPGSRRLAQMPKGRLTQKAIVIAAAAISSVWNSGDKSASR